MMSVRLNNHIVHIKNHSTLAELLVKEKNSYAVALNHHFIPRTHYATTLLKENDVIDIVTPMQGG